LRRLESVPVHRFEDLGPGQLVTGPAVIESDVTTILLGDGDEGIMTIGGHLVTTIRGQ
jgi:N-methylhydantoinase A/oxoprolinase/acetone carboxylase beta subunit